MQSSRRGFLRGLATVAGAATAQTTYGQQGQRAGITEATRPTPVAPPVRAGQYGVGVIPLVTPDLSDMPWRFEDGVKVFNISVDHVRTEFIPGRTVDAWGFNGSVPGPTIQVTEGDRVRLIVDNKLPEPFSMHWHGIEVPNAMDGMPGISQDPIPPGGRFVY